MSAKPPGETIGPVFFGQDSSLYGCYHLPPDYHHSPGVLICQPTGHEYERCHRAMRQLAVQAAKKGLSAMRFDYYATGDSAGNCEELSLARMRQDIRQAIQHFCDKTGVRHLTLVGVRLGATLAAQLASSCCEIESLVLYAPVFEGEALLNEWQRDQQAFHDKHSYSLQQVEANEVLGFRIPEIFQSEVRRKFDPETPGRALKRVLILTDETDSNSEMVNLWVEMFNHQAIDVTLEIVENIAIWRREPMEAIVPVKTIRRIVKWIGEGQDA